MRGEGRGHSLTFAFHPFGGQFIWRLTGLSLEVSIELLSEEPAVALAPFQGLLSDLAPLNEATILGHQVLASVFELVGAQVFALQLTCKVGDLVLQGASQPLVLVSKEAWPCLLDGEFNLVVMDKE